MRSLSRVLRGLASRFGWAATDQVLSAISNVVVSLAVVRGGGLPALGRYQLAFATAMVALGFLRQLVSEPLLATPRGRSGAVDGRALGASAIFGVGVGLPVSLFGLAMSTPYVQLLGPTVLALCVQDTLRYVAYRTDRAVRAAGLDLVWVLSSLALWPVVVRGGSAAAVGAWGLGAAISAVAGMIAQRLIPSDVASAIRWWWYEAKGFGGYLAAAALAYTVGTQAVSYGVAATLGEGALGQLRAALILFGPILMVQTAVGLVLVPRLVAQEPEDGRPSTHRYAMMTVVVVIGLAVLLVVLDEPIASLLFGDAVGRPGPLYTAIAIHAVVLSLSAPYLSFLRAQQAGRDVLLVYAIGYLLGGGVIVAIASVADLNAVGWAHVVQSAMVLIATTVAFGRRVRDHGSPDRVGHSTRRTR